MILSFLILNRMIKFFTINIWQMSVFRIGDGIQSFSFRFYSFENILWLAGYLCACVCVYAEMYDKKLIETTMIKQKRAFIITFFVFLSVIPLSFTNAQTYLFRNYTVDDGLPQSTIYSICQDSKGFLWFGSQGGLIRFDGNNFRNINLGNKRINWVWSMFEDRESNLLFGTEDLGLVIYDGETFTSLSTMDGLVDNAVHEVFRDKEGRYWLGTNFGLSVFDGSAWETHTKENNLTDNEIRAIYQDRSGLIWICTMNGISTFDGVVWRKYNPDVDIPFESVWDIKEDDNRLLFATNRGIASFSDGEWHVFSTSDGLIDNVVRALYIDDSGTIWAGTRRGLSSFDGKKFRNYTTKNGLVNNIIWSINKDFEGNIWIGTRGGISKFTGDYITTYTVEDGLTNDIVLSVLLDSRERLWITTHIGVSMFDGSTWRSFYTQDGLNHQRVKCAIEDRNGNIWFGTERSISVYDGKRWKSYTKDDGLVSNTIRALYEDRDGNIWIGTRQGVSKFDGKSFTNFTTADGLTHNVVRSIKQSSDGTMYFGTSHGVSIFDGQNWSALTTENGLIGNIVLTVYIDRDDDIWIGTRDGISRYDGARFTNYTQEDGLSFNICRFIIQSGDYYYFGTTRGVNRFDGQSTFKLYDSKNGMAASEVSQEACVVDKEGNLWVGTVKGLSKINTSLEIANVAPPPVFIDKVRVVGNHLELTDGIRLKHDNNFINFEFFGISFTAPENIQYKYIMEGLDRDWQLTEQPSVSYAALPPGDFTFKVYAKNFEGTWSEHPAELNFTIDPPFWSTLWFRIIVTIMIIGLIYLWIRRLKLRNIMLENKVEQRTKIINEKVEELQGSLEKISQLEDLLSICANCKKMREPDSDGSNQNSWIPVEQYISQRTTSSFSHGLCPACREKLYPEIAKNNKNNKRN